MELILRAQELPAIKMNLSSEEKLFKLKQLSKGYDPIVLQLDPVSKSWKLTTPFEIDNEPCLYYSKDPADTIDLAWDNITKNIITLKSKDQLTRFFKWNHNNNLWNEVSTLVEGSPKP